ncbi:ATP-binding protein [Specibacter sp. NPDC078692]|uniref:ATP-binding protein n=1 Tax=Specibacter sp. NPDC078692 TaxID=3155818 RepID=UPI00342CCDB1
MAVSGPRITAVRDVPPDPSIASAVGRSHTFETAIADLVDNSIDANATQVLLRFLEQKGAVVGLRLIDNGNGMDGTRLDDAMTFARKRDYDAGALGHFGLGLKAASLSQADILRVYSKMVGAQPAGRVITADKPTQVADMDGSDVQEYLSTYHADLIQNCGTVVEWDAPRTFLSSLDAGDQSRWIDERITAVMAHLGIVFHRKIATRKVEITVDVFDVDLEYSGVTRTVSAIDPFKYVPLVNDAYPAALRAKLGESEVTGIAHIWPAAQSGSPEFRLCGRPGVLAQGFYFYRNDRLLQMGGWNTLSVAKPELEYARVSIDITDDLEPHVTMNPEKSGLELGGDFKQALLGAVIGGSSSLADYLGRASGVRSESRHYVKRPVELVELGRGFSGDMLDAFSGTVGFHDSGTVDVRWRVELSEAPFEIDLESRTIWLNEQYRDIIAGTGSMDAVDAPFVKTLLVLVFSKYFEGSHLGSREKSEILAWQQLLTAALRDEIAQQAQKMGNHGDA